MDGSMGKIIGAVKKVLGGDNSTAEEQQIVRFVKNEYTKRQDERLSQELLWSLIINFVNGNQYCEINEVLRQVKETTPDNIYQSRKVFNHLAPILATRLAKLAKLNPLTKVRPSSNMRNDISAARVSTQVIKGTYYNKKMPTRIKTANVWCELLGTVFFKNVWDKQGGRVIGIAESGEDREAVREGDISVYVVPPYEIFPDSPFNQELENCHSVIHAKCYTVKDIYNIWGVKLPGKDIDVMQLRGTTMTNYLGGISSSMMITNGTQKDSETVLEYYELPSREYPEGRLIIIAGDILIHQGKLPYNVGEDNTPHFPFVKVASEENPGCFWGNSIYTRLIPVQEAYNAVRNRKIEALNQAVYGVFAYTRGSLDDETLERIEDEGIGPGTMIEVAPGANFPQFINNDTYSSAFTEEESNLIREFEHISGVSEMALKSGVPTGAGSGISLQILQEQDDTRISLPADNMRLAFVAVSIQWLRIYRQFVDGPRMIKYSNSDTATVIDWNASHLNSDDVVLETENELTQSPAQRRQMIFDLMGAGFFNGPDGIISDRMKAKITEMMELGNWEANTDISQMHIARANRENVSMNRGEGATVKSYDDDLIHIATHTLERLSEEYEERVMSNPVIDELYEQHVSEHRQNIQNQQMLEQQQAAQQQQQQM